MYKTVGRPQNHDIWTLILSLIQKFNIFKDKNSSWIGARWAEAAIEYTSITGTDRFKNLLRFIIFLQKNYKFHKFQVKTSMVFNWQKNGQITKIIVAEKKKSVKLENLNLMILLSKNLMKPWKILIQLNKMMTMGN